LLVEVWNVLRRLALDLDRAELLQMITDSRDRARGQRELFPDPVPRSDQGRREYAIRAGESLLETWLAPLPLARVRLTYALLAAGKVNMAQWGLHSHDAIWLAVAQETGRRLGVAPAMAAVDADFGRVAGLQLWGSR
jgi:hypothetical protein